MGRGPSTDIPPAAPYLTYETLASKLLQEEPAGAPDDNGTVSMLVQRPGINARHVVEEAQFSVELGMEGSGWEEQVTRGKIDQICVMGTAAIRAIAGEDEERWPAAGDQIFMDMDLGKGNLKTGDRVRVGEAVLQVTEKPHNGCGKFAKRYGVDALKIVNSPLGKERRLRGVYFCVVEPGTVKRGDRIVKLADKQS